MHDDPLHHLHQHDLKPRAAADFVAGARLDKRENVLEAGAGRGELVAALRARGARVWAVELDPALCDRLRQRFAADIAAGDVTVIAGDVTRALPDLGPGWRVIANPPFSATAILLRRWLLDELPGGPPRRLDLVLQRQAAEKCLASRWGGHTRTSVLFHLWGRPLIQRRLERDATVPPSHVPLAIFACERRDDAPIPPEMRAIDRVLEAAFAGPHRLDQAIERLVPRQALHDRARSLGIDAAAHARAVPPEAWRALAELARPALAALARPGPKRRR